MSLSNPEHLRKAYHKSTLDVSDLTPEPLDLFRRWWHEAIDAVIEEANAMTLATVDASGRPAARIVLLKGLSNEGFEFFTNYESPKARDMAYNPHVALLFFWKELERQIRIEGTAEKLPPERSTTYFQSRPRGSQIGAWSSPQSQIIPDRELLDLNLRAMETTYKGVDPLPRPDHWGGFLVRPSVYEFWQGRSDRMHDRFRYTRHLEDGLWKADRLAP